MAVKGWFNNKGVVCDSSCATSMKAMSTVVTAALKMRQLSQLLASFLFLRAFLKYLRKRNVINKSAKVRGCVLFTDPH